MSPDAAEQRSGATWLSTRPWIRSTIRGCSSVCPPTHGAGVPNIDYRSGGATMSIGLIAPALIGAPLPITWKIPAYVADAVTGYGALMVPRACGSVRLQSTTI